MSFSSDSQYLASASLDGTVHLYDTVDRRMLATSRHHGPVTGVQFHPRLRAVISTSSDRTVRLWRVTTGRELKRLVHFDAVAVAIPTADGNHLVTIDVRGRRTSWDLSQLDQRDFEVSGEVFSLMGLTEAHEELRFLYTVAGRAYIADAKHGNLNSTEDARWILALGRGAFAVAQNAQVAGATEWIQNRVTQKMSSVIKTFDISSGRERFARPFTGVSNVAISDDARLLAGAARPQNINGQVVGTNRLMAWDLASGERLLDEPLPVAVSAMAASHKLDRIVLAGRRDPAAGGANAAGTTMVWASSPRRLVLTVASREVVSSMALLEGTALVALASDDRHIKVLDVDSGQDVGVLEHDGAITRMLASVDGRRLVTSTRNGVWFWRMPERSLEHRVLVAGTPSALALSASGSLLAFGTQSGSISIFDLGSGLWAGTMAVQRRGPGPRPRVHAGRPEPVERAERNSREPRGEHHHRLELAGGRHLEGDLCSLGAGAHRCRVAHLRGCFCYRPPMPTVSKVKSGRQRLWLAAGTM